MVDAKPAVTNCQVRLNLGVTVLQIQRMWGGSKTPMNLTEAVKELLADAHAYRGRDDSLTAISYQRGLQDAYERVLALLVDAQGDNHQERLELRARRFPESKL